MNKNLSNYSLCKRIIVPLLIVNTFITSVAFRVRDIGSDSIDFQIFIKIAVWGISFGFCLLSVNLWIKKVFQWDNIFLFFLVILIVVSCFYAPNQSYSLGCAFLLVTIFSLILYSTCLLESKVILITILLTLTTISFLSIIIYFTHPHIGRMHEWIDGEFVIGNRLAGILGRSANSTGFIGAFAIFITFYLKKNSDLENYFQIFLVFAINFSALIMSGSKTSMGSLVISITVAYFLHVSVGRLALMFLSVSLILFAGSMIDFDLLFSLLSRTGEAEEITSGTGRAFIWPVVIDLINQKPLFGWGFASSSFILPEFTDEIGYPPTHAHNIFLQIVFSVGYLGLFLFTIFYLIKFYQSVKWGDEFKLAGLVFILVRGMTESPAFTGVATAPTLAFATLFLINYRQKDGIRNCPY